jgi:hypothetical protein
MRNQVLYTISYMYRDTHWVDFIFDFRTHCHIQSRTSISSNGHTIPSWRSKRVNWQRCVGNLVLILVSNPYSFDIVVCWCMLNSQGISLQLIVKESRLRPEYIITRARNDKSKANRLVIGLKTFPLSLGCWKLRFRFGLWGGEWKVKGQTSELSQSGLKREESAGNTSVLEEILRGQAKASSGEGWGGYECVRLSYFSCLRDTCLLLCDCDGRWLIFFPCRATNSASTSRSKHSGWCRSIAIRMVHIIKIELPDFWAPASQYVEPWVQLLEILSFLHLLALWLQL